MFCAQKRALSADANLGEERLWAVSEALCAQKGLIQASAEGA